MNALVRKEIRLLLPSWVAALLLAFAPVFFVFPPADRFPLLLAWFGLVMMAVNSAGREFSLGTFSPLLAQPWPRTRTWWTKVSVLALAQLIVFSVWWALFSTHLAGHSEAAPADFFSKHALLVCGLLVLAAYSGGLWTSLLFRQMAPSFWMALLVPVALAVSVASLMDRCSENAVTVVLSAVFGVYGIAGFWWARRLFLRAQDVGWTGGTVSLPAWLLSRSQSNSFVQTRRRRPATALFWKELQLHQLTLACAGALIALHLISLLMRMTEHKSFTLRVALEGFWLLWLVIPVIVGCTAVAEERKMGVADGQLCLPVSSRVQFAIKLLMAVVLGTLLGGLLPYALECGGIAFGVPSIMFSDYVLPFPFPSMCLFVIPCSLGLALVAFFASTLARNFLQSLATAMVAIAVCAAFIVSISIRQTVFGITLWHYVLPDLVAVPTLTIALLWLAYRNFEEFQENARLWRRNLLGLTTALAFVVVTSAALYNRIWEIFTPLEPPHGPAQLTLSKAPHMRCDHDGNLTILLPDGTVWLDEIWNSWLDEMWDHACPAWRWELARLLHPLPGSLGPHQFIDGSNWVDVNACWWAISGIRSDGGLWIAEKTNKAAWISPKLTMFGNETNWLAVAQSRGRPSALLLKKDGTLWWWGTNQVEWTVNEGPRWPMLTTFKPYRLGTNSDWAQVFSFSGVYARKADGTVWTVESNSLVQATTFGRTKWRGLVSGLNKCRFGVRDDGTLWICRLVWNNTQWVAPEMVQVGKETDWEATAVSWQCLVALKSDGSLWKWDVLRTVPSNGSLWESQSVIANTTPTRLGIHSDWVAVADQREGVVSLAADGSLWYWPDKEFTEEPTPLLRPPRKPQLLANIFGSRN